jgi:AcrR family transcriptional regulator
MSNAATEHNSMDQQGVRERILESASRLFYQRGVRAVGIDLVIAEANVAKTSLYRYFRRKDDLIAAFLEREDADFWGMWERVASAHTDDPAGELNAQLEWIGERVGRQNYRGCPQINVAAEFPQADHPARAVAASHKREMRKRLRGIAKRLGVKRPSELAGQLSLLINGAFVSSQILDANEAKPLLRRAAYALVEACQV